MLPDIFHMDEEVSYLAKRIYSRWNAQQVNQANLLGYKVHLGYHK